MRIRVVEVGSGPPVFVAHGTAGSGPVMAALLAELPDRTFLLMDRPGFGLSSPIRYSASTFRQTVADLQRDVLDQFLLDHDLVDRLDLLVFPVIVGAGRRLFPDSGIATGLALDESRTTKSGVTLSVYRTTGRPEFGEVEVS